MQRNNWTFDHTAGELIRATRAKLNYHRERRSHWEAKRIEWMNKIREEGLEISDEGSEFLDFTSLPRRRGGPEVKVNPELKRHVSECHERVQSHSTAIDDFQNWLQVLEAHPDQVLALEHDDWLFFFGK